MNRRLKKIFSGKVLATIFATTSIVVTFFIFVFIFYQGLPAFEEIGILDFLLGTEWRPTGSPPSFGILPLFYGSLLVTGLALLVSVPIGIFGAIYIHEVAHSKVRKLLKPISEILAGVPSVIYGFFGLVVLVPWVKETFGLPVGETAFTAGIILGIMVLPIIISVSEDAMSSVPEKYRSASLALGATRWQTMTKVVIPSAASGISSSIILAFGRAIGETIAVMMIVGGSPIMPLTIFKPVRPMPATIAAEMGEIAYGSTHFHALFAIGIILLTTTFVTNYVAKKIMTRGVIEE